MSLSIVILAAGKGSRMKSSFPKVLHPLAGKPLVSHVVSVAKRLKPEQIVIVYGHGGEQVKQQLADEDVIWVEQEQQLGTGHAIQQALPSLNINNTILTLYGDVPLITQETLTALIGVTSATTLGLLTVELDDPTGYGRIVREQGEITEVVEHKDASPEQHRIREVNTGIMCVPGVLMESYLGSLDNNNAQGEFYLTDIIGLHSKTGQRIQSVHPSSALEVEGINDRKQLSIIERRYQSQLADNMMMNGVSFADPSRVEFRGDIQIESDTFVDVNVVFEGDCKIGSNCVIEPGVIVRDSEIGNGCRIKANSVLEEAILGNEVAVGPFARLRPNTVLADKAQIGNFVEIKKTRMGVGSKASHLSYLGDANIGNNVNIGAGTITCNYDGANKHVTTIEDEVFIGSDTQLVAPVTIGKGATVGAGTTVTADVGHNELAISRVKQKNLSGYQRPVKKK